MLDIFMAQIVLQRTSILPVIGQLEATGMAQHVRMHRKPDPGLFPCTCHHLPDRGGRQGAFPLGHKDILCLWVVSQ